MANILTMRRVLGFKDFFPNETPRTREFYAAKVGRDTIEKTTPFFLSFLRHKGNPDVSNLLKEWFTFNNFNYTQSVYYTQIDQEYRRIQNHHPNEKHSIIAVESLLNLFLWIRENKEVPDVTTDNDASVTLPFLELILLFNDDVLSNYQKAIDSIQQYGTDRRIQRIILAGSFSQSDLVNIDYAQLFYTQIYKKTKLLSFIETNPKYSGLLERLLEEFGCSSKEEFLKAIGSAVVIPLKTNEPSWSVLSVENNPEKEKSIRILDNLAISDNKIEVVEQDDYLLLRNKPFYKIDEGQYRVIFELFLIKKLYNGLIFKLSSYDETFLGKIREDFSEGVLVYETLNAILALKHSIIITGNQFKKCKLKREPDFYSRNNNDILLFESKDFFMSGRSKLSYDFNIIENELRKDGRLKKAVIQLVTNIGRCILKQLPLDNAYDIEEISLFPVIIVHDSLYSAPALNYWVYYWFIDELESLKRDAKYKEFDFAKIIPITLIEIDTLILYEKYFATNRIDLVTLIKNYHDYVRFDLSDELTPDVIEEHALKSAISFSEFVRDYAQKDGIQIDFEIVEEKLKEFGVV